MERNALSIALVLTAALFSSCRQEHAAARTEPSGSAGESERALSVEVLELKPEPFTSYIESSGTTLPARESFLSLPVPGTIERILVERGQAVKKGQVLLRLDQSGFRLGVEQAKAALAAAKAGFGTLDTQMKRFDRLLANKAVPRADYDKVKAQYDAAAAQLAMAEVGLKQAEKALRDSELRAPYDGVITMILKEVGEYAPSMPPTMLMKIVDSSTLQVQTFLPEVEAPFVSVGDEAQVTVDSAGYTGTARVTFVSPRLEPGTHTFEVRFSMDNPGQIKAGAFCRIRLVRRKLDRAILVPLRAIVREGDHSFAYLLDGGTARRAELKLGETSGDRVLVLSGLKDNDRIITTALDRLRPGQAVLAADSN